MYPPYFRAQPRQVASCGLRHHQGTPSNAIRDRPTHSPSPAMRDCQPYWRARFRRARCSRCRAASGSIRSACGDVGVGKLRPLHQAQHFGVSLTEPGERSEDEATFVEVDRGFLGSRDGPTHDRAQAVVQSAAHAVVRNWCPITRWATQYVHTSAASSPSGTSSRRRQTVRNVSATASSTASAATRLLQYPRMARWHRAYSSANRASSLKRLTPSMPLSTLMSVSSPSPTLRTYRGIASVTVVALPGICISSNGRCCRATRAVAGCSEGEEGSSDMNRRGIGAVAVGVLAAGTLNIWPAPATGHADPRVARDAGVILEWNRITRTHVDRVRRADPYVDGVLRVHGAGDVRRRGHDRRSVSSRGRSCPARMPTPRRRSPQRPPCTRC